MYKAQTKAIIDIKNTSEDSFQDIVNKAKSLSEPKKNNLNKVQIPKRVLLLER